MAETEVMNWLLDSDPALRWQVERDLAGSPDEVWQATRARVATEGMGARLLALQGDDGLWAGGAYFPADFDFEGPEAAPEAGQPWTATTWSLNSLRWWGTDAAALTGTADKIAENARWEYDDLPYWGGEVDCCINAFTLANGTWLGADVSTLPQWFLDHEMEEGGWNCEWVEGSVRASVYSTLSTIDGILWWEQATGGTPELTAARKRAQEYLLERRILYKVTTGEAVRPGVELLAYPQRSKYNVLHAVNYFRDASLHDGAAPDPRLGDAVDVIRRQRQPDGTWLQGYRYPGRVWFEEDVPVGEPSKWVTFLALRGLQWWDAATPARA